MVFTRIWGTSECVLYTYICSGINSPYLMLQLIRPLAIIDLETTGVNLGIDRIIEIAIVRIGLDGNQTVKRNLINPEMPIPQITSDVHGITDEMVKDAPTFKAGCQ